MIAYKKVWPDAGEGGGSQPNAIGDQCIPTLRVHTKLVRVLRDTAGLNRRSLAEKAAAAVMARAVETLSVQERLKAAKVAQYIRRLGLRTARRERLAPAAQVMLTTCDACGTDTAPSRRARARTSGE